MLKTIIQASENFCIHQIRLPHSVGDESHKKRTLIAYIDIQTQDDKQHRVYLASDFTFMQRVAKLFLEEDESDDETLQDMALETVNLIVGSAKVIAEELNANKFNIGTPHYLKTDEFNLDYDEIKVIKIENDEMIIAIKGL